MLEDSVGRKASPEKGADAKQVRQQCGSVQLLMASLNGHAGSVPALLRKGAGAKSVNQQNGALPLLMSPLLMASQNGHVDCIKALLDGS